MKWAYVCMVAIREHAANVRLLPGHGDAEPFLGGDEVVLVVVADVELDPPDAAGEHPVRGVVVAAGRF